MISTPHIVSSWKHLVFSGRDEDSIWNALVSFINIRNRELLTLHFHFQQYSTQELSENSEYRLHSVQTVLYAQKIPVKRKTIG